MEVSEKGLLQFLDDKPNGGSLAAKAFNQPVLHSESAQDSSPTRRVMYFAKVESEAYRRLQDAVPAWVERETAKAH